MQWLGRKLWSITRILKNLSRNTLKILVVTLILLKSNLAFAVDYTFDSTVGLTPNTFNFPTTPLTMLNTGINSTLNVQSGTMAATAGAFTITQSSLLSFIDVDVQSGATLSYAGANASANTIDFTFDTAAIYYADINNAGTISNGTATSGNAISISDVSDYSVLVNTGTITGNIAIIGGIDMYINGADAIIDGTITVVPGIGDTSSLTLGNVSEANFITGGAIAGILDISLVDGSFTGQHAISGLDNSVTIAALTNFAVNASIAGTATTSNSGHLTIGTGGVFSLSGAMTNNSGDKTITVSGGTFNVPASFTNTGIINFEGTTGSIVGDFSGTGAAEFNIGVSDVATTFTTGTAFSMPEVNVTGGTLTANHAITGVDTSFIVGADGIAVLNAAVVGTGLFTNNGTVTTGTANAIATTGVFTNAGTLNINSSLSTTGFTTPTNSGTINVNNVTFTTNGTFTHTGTLNVNNGSGAVVGALAGGAGSTLNIGPVTSNPFVVDAGGIAGFESINVILGSFTAANPVTGITTTFIMDSGTTGTISSTFSGTGTVANNGTLALNTGANISGFATFINNNILNVGGMANAITIANNSSMTIAGTVTGAGTIYNTSTLVFSSGSNANSIYNNSTFNVTGAAANSGAVSNDGTMTISAALSGAGTITNSSIGTLVLSTGSSNANTIINNGTFNISAATTNTGAITNNLTMSIAANLSGAGSITNSSTGTLTQSTGTNANSVVNNGNFNITGSSTINNTITNNNLMTISAALAGTSDLTNSSSGTLTLNGTANVSKVIVNNGYLGIDGPTVALTTALTGTGSLNIGPNLSSTTFTTGNTISMPTVNVLQGTFTVSNAISGINTAFTVASGATTTINVALAGTGAFTNNGTVNTGVADAIGTTGIFTNTGTLNLNNAFTTTGFTTPTNSGTVNINGITLTTNSSFITSGIVALNGVGSNVSGQLTGTSGSTLNIAMGVGNTFTSSAAILNFETINVLTGTLTAATSVSGVNTAFTVSSGATANISNTFSGFGGVTNNGTMTINNAAASVSGFTSFINNNILNIGLAANAIAITNNGTLTISGALSGAGSIANTGTLIMSGGSNTNTITNSNIFNVTGAAANTGTITNSGTMTISAALSGVGTITNSSSGTLVLAASGSNSNTITNNGTFNVTGAATNTGAITNNNTMTISAALAGAGTIANSSGATLVFASGADVTNTVTNSSGGTFNVTGSSTSNSSITNNGAMDLAANLSMAGFNLITGATGSLTLDGIRTLTASAYTNTGTHYTTITSDTVYDRLICTGCAVDLSSGTLDINAAFFTATPGVTYPFTLITGTSIVSPTVVTQFPSAAFATMTLVNTGTQLNLNYVLNDVVRLAYPGINQEIAQVLQQMSADTMNAQQTALINAVYSTTSVAAYNQALNSLIPNANSVVPNIVVQNESINKVESRIAALRDSHYGSPILGFNAGDINPNRSTWLSTFGSITNQKAVDENQGYKAKTIGLLLGTDRKYCRENYIGMAFGVSGSHINEYSNLFYTTNTTRYHALGYGTHNLKRNGYLDWLVTGSLNNNKGKRPVNISGTDFGVTSDYNSYLFAAKLVRGQAYDFWTSYRFTPLTFIQYTYANQQSYDESGSPAALHIAEQTKNIVTLGAGFKFAFPIDAWRLIGMRELRAIGTYDALSNNDSTVANFVAGSNSFSVVNTPGRWGLKLGASITFATDRCWEFVLNYDFDIRSGFTDSTLLAKVRYVF